MGWLGTLLLFAGQWQIGSRDRLGFLLVSCGEMLWLCRAVETGQPDLFVLSLVFAGLAGLNFYRWSAPDERYR